MGANPAGASFFFGAGLPSFIGSLLKNRGGGAGNMKTPRPHVPHLSADCAPTVPYLSRAGYAADDAAIIGNLASKVLAHVNAEPVLPWVILGRQFGHSDFWPAAAL